MECALEVTSLSGGFVQWVSVMNRKQPSGKQSRASLSPKDTFGFGVTFQTTTTKSSAECSPGPATPKTQSSVLIYALISSMIRAGGRVLSWNSKRTSSRQGTSPLRCRRLPWGGEPWRSLEPTPGIMLSDGSHPDRCSLAQSRSCPSRQKAAPGPQELVLGAILVQSCASK